MMTRRIFLAASASPLGLRLSAAKPRLPRKDCFFGVHFDLHPSKDDKTLGRDVDDEMVRRFLVRVAPDFVQYDCKGHAGYLGFVSKTGTSAPGIVNDSLAVWRRVTADRGVGLFIHFSGVWDSLAVEQHPAWARVGPDGKRDERQTSTFGPYVDQLMIPQLLEAADKYDLDGAWVDGECWATNPDYCAAAAKMYHAKTGYGLIPKKPGEPGWLEFLELNREQFRSYVRHYVDVIHKARPGFQIASNWLYSTFVPEKPDLPVDFLSGDYLGNASISRARLEARYLAMTGKPWDLMAWGFQSGGSNHPVGIVHKSSVQLQQEAAVVLAQGGGFQVYYQPTRSGYIDERHVIVMESLARFCRARQPVSHKTEPVPQIGLVFSSRTLYRTANKLFGGWGRAVDCVNGWLDALVENRYSVDVIPDWKLEEVISSYPLIVVPEWADVGEDIRKAIILYVRAGGKAVVSGAENAALFAADLDVRLSGKPGVQDAFVLGDVVFGNAHGAWQDVQPIERARVTERRYPVYDSTRDGASAATESKMGAGTLAAVYGPIGTVFAQTHAPAIRQFVRRIVSRLFIPAYEVEGPPVLETSLRTKEGNLLLHLANFANMQVASDYASFDYIPPVGPFVVTVKMKAKPARVVLHPDGRVIEGEWRNGLWRGTIDRVEIHSVLAMQS